jgi:hypothetical protein
MRSSQSDDGSHPTGHLLKPKRLLSGYLAGALVTSIACGLVPVFALNGSSTSSTATHTMTDKALWGLLDHGTAAGAWRPTAADSTSVAFLSDRAASNFDRPSVAR